MSEYPAPCPGLPLFVRAGSDRLFASLNAALRAIPRGTIRSGVTTATYQAGVDRDLNVTG